jgi:hypothetical protein
MPIVDGLNFTQHGWERAQERGVSIEDVIWAMNGARQGIEEGKTLCQRWYTDAGGYRWGIFVILSSTGRIITTWVREG